MDLDHIITATVWLLTVQIIVEYGISGPDPARLRESAPNGLRALAKRVLVQALLAGLALLPHFGPVVVPSLLLLVIVQELAKTALRGRYASFGLRYFYRHPFSGEIALLLFVLATSSVWVVAMESFLSQQAPAYYGSPHVQKVLIAVAGLVFVTRGGTGLIRSLLSQMGKGSQQSPGDEGQIDFNAGRMIGNLERILILGMALSGHITAIGFVLAAKSIARFKNLEADQKFAEYYLLGTLASALIALATAEAVRGPGTSYPD